MKVVVCCIWLTVFPISLFAQTSVAGQATPGSPTQATAVEELKRMNQELVELHQQGKLDDALKVAKRIQALVDKEHLNDDPTALPILMNVGAVFVDKGKTSDIIALFLRLLDSYRKTPGEHVRQDATITDRLARAYFVKGDYRKALEYCLRAIPLFQQVYGEVNAPLAAAYTILGNTYRALDQPERVSDPYLKAIAINDQVLNEGEKESRTDIDNYICFLYQQGFQHDRFDAAVTDVMKFQMSRIPKLSDNSTEPIRVVTSGVVNGRATYLAKPEYPPQTVRTRGFMIVKVMIDEQGRVVDAHATCGDETFRSVSEDAARRSRFTPTALKGLPVKVSGMIIYSFGK
jgi:hypothetical protein